MRIPDYLTNEYAKAFWRKHVKRLESQQMISDSDAECLGLLAEVWGLLRQCKPMDDSKEAIRYIALLKQFQTLAKPFGLLEKRKPKSDDDDGELFGIGG